MRLSDYLARHGDKEVARRIGASDFTVRNWRLGEKVPGRKLAKRLIETSRGELSWSDIYDGEAR